MVKTFNSIHGMFARMDMKGEFCFTKDYASLEERCAAAEERNKELEERLQKANKFFDALFCPDEETEDLVGEADNG